MNKVYVFLADGFEEIEALTVVDLLRRADVRTVMVSLENSKVVTGGHSIEVEADIMFNEALEVEASLFVIPGGLKGVNRIKAHEGMEKIIKKAYDDQKYIAAICAGPTVLAQYGLLEGRKATCHPSVTDELAMANYCTDSVVKDGKIITSRGLGTAIDFAGALVELCQGTKEKESVYKSIVYGE